MKVASRKGGQSKAARMAEYNHLLSQRVSAYASEINQLEALVAKLQRIQFGKSSEKLRANDNLNELSTRQNNNKDQIRIIIRSIRNNDRYRPLLAWLSGDLDTL